MSKTPKEPKIVAGLGRPETASETQARKAENSRLYVQRKTVNNLVLSLLATVGLVVVIFFAVPRSNVTPNWQVDYVGLSEQAALGMNGQLITPEMPSDWKANAAEVRSSAADGVTSWYIGFITPSSEFIGYQEALIANPTWVANTLKGNAPTGSRAIGTQEWTEYDYRSMEDTKNLAYALVTVRGDSTFILYGTANDAEFTALAEKISTQIEMSSQ
ncbi:MAG: DUF4245 domain-containing protein [Actinomycetales bacterium]|nr:DUF4245 domain-containing protein [Actinomycetales bacterium]